MTRNDSSTAECRHVTTSGYTRTRNAIGHAQRQSSKARPTATATEKQETEIPTIDTRPEKRPSFPQPSYKEAKHSVARLSYLRLLFVLHPKVLLLSTLNAGVPVHLSRIPLQHILAIRKNVFSGTRSGGEGERRRNTSKQAHQPPGGTKASMARVARARQRTAKHLPLDLLAAGVRVYSPDDRVTRSHDACRAEIGVQVETDETEGILYVLHDLCFGDEGPGERARGPGGGIFSGRDRGTQSCCLCCCCDCLLDIMNRSKSGWCPPVSMPSSGWGTRLVFAAFSKGTERKLKT